MLLSIALLLWSIKFISFDKVRCNWILWICKERRRHYWDMAWCTGRLELVFGWKVGESKSRKIYILLIRYFFGVCQVWKQKWKWNGKWTKSDSPSWIVLIYLMMKVHFDNISIYPWWWLSLVMCKVWLCLLLALNSLIADRSPDSPCLLRVPFANLFGSWLSGGFTSVKAAKINPGKTVARGAMAKTILLELWKIRN